MKKFLTRIFALAAAFLLCVPVPAASAGHGEAAAAYTIVVDGQVLDIRGLPTAPYAENGTVMVPLRKIGEALGYQVEWNAETRAITVDDGYIQKATLFSGTAAVIFEGRLQIIDMGREIENTVQTTIHDGCTYVPLEFFQEFLNDVEIEGSLIQIAPSRCEICAE